MTTDQVKDMFEDYVRQKRREVSLAASIRECGSDEAEEGLRRQLQDEREETSKAKERIRKAAADLPSKEREIVTERYLSPIPIRAGGRVVGWKLKGWNEVARLCGYSVRNCLRYYRHALARLAGDQEN